MGILDRNGTIKKEEEKDSLNKTLKDQSKKTKTSKTSKKEK